MTEDDFNPHWYPWCDTQAVVVDTDEEVGGLLAQCSCGKHVHEDRAESGSGFCWCDK